MKKILVRSSIILIILAAAYGGYRLVQQMPQRKEQVPTARVRRGDVIIRSYSRGELRAVRSVTLTAPNLHGTVQVTKLAPMGAFAREKDLIVEFDDSDVLSRLEEKQLELDQNDEQIRKAEAELAIRNNQDQVELLRTRYSVRRAELEVKRNELLSEIDRRKNLLNLDEARRRLQQLESDIKSRLEQAKAEIAVLREERNKSVIELGREKQRLSQTKLLSPISGLVSILPNRFGGGRMFGMQVPDIREGDQVQPGMPVSDVLDLSELEVVAKVGELDRANLLEGQDVTIQLDALAGKKLHGKIKSLSGTASANIWSGDPSKKFDVTFSVDMQTLLSAVGAKSDQIRRVMETAERNRKKPVAQMAMISFSRGGPADAAFGMAAGIGENPGGAGESGGPSAERRRRGPRTEGGRQLSEEDRNKRRAAIEKELGGRKLEDLTAEERRKIFAKLRQSTGDRPRTAGESADPPLPGSDTVPFSGRGAQFSEKEMAEAKLPPAPEEDNQLNVLLRPGLLADVEIIVEKIPNAIYIPAQAVFEKDGKPVVYVKSDRRFEERSVKFTKQSESTMVVSEGLKPGEIVALADPTAGTAEKKSGKPAGGAGPMGGSPAGGKG